MSEAKDAALQFIELADRVKELMSVRNYDESKALLGWIANDEAWERLRESLTEFLTERNQRPVDDGKETWVSFTKYPGGGYGTSSGEVKLAVGPGTTLTELKAGLAKVLEVPERQITSVRIGNVHLKPADEVLDLATKYQQEWKREDVGEVKYETYRTTTESVKRKPMGDRWDNIPMLIESEYNLIVTSPRGDRQSLRVKEATTGFRAMSDAGASDILINDVSLVDTQRIADPLLATLRDWPEPITSIKLV